MHLVTAKHVLDEIRGTTSADAVLITYNGPNGKEETKIDLSDWNYRPRHGAENVDHWMMENMYRTLETARFRAAGSLGREQVNTEGRTP